MNILDANILFVIYFVFWMMISKYEKYGLLLLFWWPLSWIFRDEILSRAYLEPFIWLTCYFIILQYFLLRRNPMKTPSKFWLFLMCVYYLLVGFSFFLLLFLIPWDYVEFWLFLVGVYSCVWYVIDGLFKFVVFRYFSKNSINEK